MAVYTLTPAQLRGAGVYNSFEIPAGGGTPSFSNVNSFEFDGVDDYFLGAGTYSEIDGLNNFAFSFWIKPSTLANFRQIVTIGTSNADYRAQQIQIASTSGRIQVYVSGMSYFWNSTASLTQDAWNHILVTRDSSRPINEKGKVYINGVDASSSDNTRHWTNNAVANSGLMIGRHNNGWSSLFSGKIDEVAVYTQDMASYISEIYGGGQPVDLNNLATAPQPTTWQRMGEDATWNGATWTMTDINSGYTNRSINMVEANRTTDVPIPFTNTKSILLDGVDDFVTMGDTLDFERTESFSLSAWIKRGTTGVDDSIVSKMESSGSYRGYFLYITNSNKIRFILRNVNTTSNRLFVDSTSTITNTNWNHILVTYDGSSSGSGVKIYINGVSDTVTTTGTLSATILNSSPFNIGARNSNSLFATATIDEVSVFNSELSQSDVTSIYNGGVPNDISSLSPLSWWRCGDGDTSPTLTDNGSASNNGTMTNFTTFSTDVPT